MYITEHIISMYSHVEGKTVKKPTVRWTEKMTFAVRHLPGITALYKFLGKVWLTRFALISVDFCKDKVWQTWKCILIITKKMNCDWQVPYATVYWHDRDMSFLAVGFHVVVDSNNIVPIIPTVTYVSFDSIVNDITSAQPNFQISKREAKS